MAILKLKFTAAILLAAGILTGLSFHGLAQQGAPKPLKTPGATAVKIERLAEKKAAEEEKKADEVSVKSMPPVVVKTVPQAGDTEVDADKIKEIRVTFSKDMMDKSWSWVQISDETFPKKDGEVRYDKDNRTCVYPVKLEPGKTYVVWLNSEQYQNFKDADGNPAVPYLLVFQTKPKK